MDAFQHREVIMQEVEVKVLPGAEVAVAGGGTAGVTAAVAAARAGAKVMLIERYGYLGGMMTAGNAGLTMYTRFSGNSREHVKDQKALENNPEEIQIAGGITREITERLLESGMARGNHGTFGNYVFTSSEDFKRLLFRMMQEAKVNLRLHSTVVDAVVEDDCIKGLIIESKSGRELVPAQQFVDATGDGDVAARAGAPFTVGVTEDDICAAGSETGKMAVAGVMFKVGNVDLHRTFNWLEKNPDRFVEHVFARFSLEIAKRNFENNETATMTIRYSANGRVQVYNLPNEGVVTLCCPNIANIDGCNAEELTRAEVLMASVVKRLMENVRANIPGFENIFLLDCPQIGVRETRHVQGEYVLNIMDIYKQKKFDDCIGLGSHPVDVHPRPEWLEDPGKAYPPRWYFQIPYRCLVAKKIKNLLVSGRCISATHEAFGCIRPTVQCMITGEAAGSAAALCVRESVAPASLDVKLLQETLKTNGVLL